MNNIVIVIPGLLSNLATTPEIKKQEFFSLRFMLARAHVKPIIQNNLDTLLVSSFSESNADEFSIAAITALADGLPAQEGYWLRADPVELRSDFSAVYFLDGEHLNLTLDEIQVLMADLNSFLVQEGMTLHAPTKIRWYLKLSEESRIKTFYSNDLVGKDIGAYLPCGDRQTYFRKLSTEIQMLLHNHEVNQRRLKEKKPLVNALWFSGEGISFSLKSHWKKMLTNDVVAKGLAMSAKIPLIENSEEFLNEIDGSGEYLFVLQLPSDALLNNKRCIEENKLEWNLENLNEKLFDPLLKNLRKGNLNNVTFYFDEKKSFYVTNKNIRYFWRRKKYF